MKLEKPFFFRVTSEEENTPIKVQDVQIFKTTSERKIVTIEKVQKFKDQYLISERCIQAFKNNLFQEIPSLCKLRDYRKELKNKIAIQKNSKGVFNDLRNKISSILTLISQTGIIDLTEYATIDQDSEANDPKRHGNSEAEMNAQTTEAIGAISVNKEAATKIFQLKFAGDGTVVSRNITIFNFVFTCLNESNRCESASGHYTLGIFEINKENYEELRECLTELAEQIKNLDHVQIENKKYKIKKYLAGDLKFLALMKGINGANAKYPCLWCTTGKDHYQTRGNNLQEYSMISNGARSEQEADRGRHFTAVDAKLGYDSPGIDFGIGFKDTVVDMLHMFLRISERILESFMYFLHKLDHKNTLASEAELLNAPFLTYFVNQLKGLRYKEVYYFDGSSKKLKIKDLTGNEYLKVLRSLIQENRDNPRPRVEIYRQDLTDKNPERTKETRQNQLDTFIKVCEFLRINIIYVLILTC